MRNFMDSLRAQWDQKKFLCVGLDSDKELLPPVKWQTGQMAREWQLIFNKEIIDAVADFVAAFKLNPAFYASDGLKGLWVLGRTIYYILGTYPQVPVILDGKFGDVDNSARHYAKFAFEGLGADALTVNPYLGREEAQESFLERKDKGIFVVCRTTNKGAREIQDFAYPEFNSKLHELIAATVSSSWNTYGNCGLVAGATDIEALRNVRKRAPDVPILVPGVGVQGGNARDAVLAARDSRNQGFLIAVSRSIIFASGNSDFAEAAGRKAKILSRIISKALKEAGKEAG